MKTDIEKQEMRSYLLGILPQDRQTDLEQRILSDGAVYEELLVAENDLIDQYVAGTLSGLEKHRFETHFLITPERQKKLRFGKLFKRYLSSHQVLVPPEELADLQTTPSNPTASRKRAQFSMAVFRRNPVLAFSMIVVTCLGLALLFWFLIKTSARNYAHRESTSTVVVTLAPGSMRSEGAIRQVPAPLKGVDVTLELEVANAEFPNYKAQLFREREHLQTREKLKTEQRGGHRVVPVTITGEILRPGDYQLKLSGVLDTGKTEFIDSYSFRVTAD